METRIGVPSIATTGPVAVCKGCVTGGREVKRRRAELGE